MGRSGRNSPGFTVSASTIETREANRSANHSAYERPEHRCLKKDRLTRRRDLQVRPRISEALGNVTVKRAAARVADTTLSATFKV